MSAQCPLLKQLRKRSTAGAYDPLSTFVMTARSALARLRCGRSLIGTLDVPHDDQAFKQAAETIVISFLVSPWAEFWLLPTASCMAHIHMI